MRITYQDMYSPTGLFRITPTRAIPFCIGRLTTIIFIGQLPTIIMKTRHQQ